MQIRIDHSHNTSVDKDFKKPLKMYYRSRISSVATEFLACGKEAGDFLFPGKDALVIPNAIDKKKFVYDSLIRENKRRELGITDETVFGHVGRISYQKNHDMLVEIFANIVKKKPDSILLIIGVGEKEQEIREKVYALGINDKVRFLGKRTDVNELYQAMDVFVMPSFFEGVPVVGVEAQFAKLFCFFSDKVPDEVAFTDSTYFIPLAKSPEEWASDILYNLERAPKRENIEILDDRYDIDKAYICLENYYKNLYDNLKE